MTLICCKAYDIDFYDIADLLVIPTAFTLILGKLANYTNSELYGKITNPQSTPWCVVFQKVDNYCRHPAQIYESISNVFLFGILFSYYAYHEKIKQKYQKGTIFWAFVLVYSVFRFIVTFYRDEPLYYGLNIGQWLSILTVAISAIFLYKAHKSKNKSKSI